MTDIVLLGGGNVGYHLANIFLSTAKTRLIQIYNRNINAIRCFENEVSITDNLNHIKKAGIYIICVSDKAIAEVSEALPNNNALVVHTSGATSLEILNTHKRYGVFYPLQTFSRDRSINFSSIPICIESNLPADLILLQKLATSISNKVYSINSRQRNSLHIAAVFVNNFVNQLYYIGNEICEKDGIPGEILHPLIDETAKKIRDLTPYNAQTGPAKRGDEKTIQNHLKNLTGINKEIYKLLTHSIAQVYGKKL